MKFKYLSFSAIGVFFATVIMRIVQLLYMVDTGTGFIKQPYKRISFDISVLIIFLIFALTFFSFYIRRSPVKMPRPNFVLGAVSAGLGLSILYEVFDMKYAERIPAWQIVFLTVFGLLSAVFFIVYGAKGFFKFHLPRITYVLPCFYWVAKIICTFSEISSIALITDNVFIIASYCAVLIFMLEFAKLANFIDVNKNYKKMFPAAICSILLSAVYCVPRVLITIFGKGNVLHQDVTPVISVFFTFLFILVFSYYHFGNKNLIKKKHHRSSTKFMPGNGGDQFYTDYKRH